jgi:hypothetical protein
LFGGGCAMQPSGMMISTASEQPFVLHDAGIDHRRQLRHDVAAAIAKGVPHTDQFGAVVGTGEIDGELIALHRARHVNLDVLGTLGIVIDEHVGLVSAVRPRDDFFPEAFLGVLDVVIDGRLHHLDAARPDDLLQAGAPAICTPLIIAARSPEKLAKRLLRSISLMRSRRFFTAMHQLDAGNGQALGENIRGFQGEAAGVLAPGIALVSLQALDQHQFALVVKHRGINVVVRQVAAAVVRIVAQKNIAGAPVILLERFQGRSAPSAARRKVRWGCANGAGKPGGRGRR